MPRWLKIVLIVAAVLGFAWEVNIYGFQLKRNWESRQFQKSFDGNMTAMTKGRVAKARATPPAHIGVYAGTAPAWRTLRRSTPTLISPDGTTGTLLSGHFIAGSPDRQVLLIGEQQSEYFTAAGTAHPVQLHGEGFEDYSVAWDYDGDGVDDIVPSAWGIAMAEARAQKASSSANSLSIPSMPAETPVFALSGDKLGTLPGAAVIASAQPGDFDGDGKIDLIFPVANDQHLLQVIGQRGASVDELTVPDFNYAVAAHCVDERRDELVCNVFKGANAKHAQLVTLRGAARVLQATISGRPAPLLAGPLTQAGVDDIVYADGFIDTTADKFVAFSTQPSPGLTLPGLPWLKPVIANLPALGGRVVAVPGEMRDLTHGYLAIYDANGKVVFGEVFTTEPHGLALLTEGGVDHIVLQFDDRLLIYP